MDLDAFKLLLESQDRAFRSAMDVVIEQLKGRIQITEGTITDLIKSLEYSQAEIVDLRNEVKVLKKTDSEKQVEIDCLKSKITEMQHRLNFQEDYSRRNNLRITGFHEQPGGETWEETSTNVTKLLEEKLQLPPMKLERAHRVGTSNPTRPRTIVARFEKFGDREAVMRNARKLKGTGIFIDDDLCSHSQEIKRNQIPLLKQARQEGKIAYFKYTRLIIRDRMGQQPASTSSDASRHAARGGSDASGAVVRGASGVDASRHAVRGASASSVRVSSTDASGPAVRGAPGGSMDASEHTVRGTTASSLRVSADASGPMVHGASGVSVDASSGTSSLSAGGSVSRGIGLSECVAPESIGAEASGAQGAASGLSAVPGITSVVGGSGVVLPQGVGAKTTNGGGEDSAVVSGSAVKTRSTKKPKK